MYGIHSPLAVRQNHASPTPSGQKFNGHVFTAAPVQVHSQPFEPRRTTGGTDIQTSKRKYTFVPNLRAIQQNFNHHCHSSKPQPSFHSSPFQPSFQEVSVVNVCADS